MITCLKRLFKRRDRSLDIPSAAVSACDFGGFYSICGIPCYYRYLGDGVSLCAGWSEQGRLCYIYLLASGMTVHITDLGSHYARMIRSDIIERSDRVAQISKEYRERHTKLSQMAARR